MRALLFFSYFFLISLVSFGQELTPRMDSILQEIGQLEGEEKLDKWKWWMMNPTKDDLPFRLPMIDKAYEDAIDIVGKDSAMVWSFYLQSEILRGIHSFGQGSFGPILLDSMKNISDSLTSIKGFTHYTLGDWYYLLGQFYYMQVDMDKAEEFLKKAIEVSQKVKNDAALFRVYRSICLMKSYLGSYAEAKKASMSADSLLNFVDIPVKEEYRFYHAKAYMYNYFGEYDLADSFYLKVIDSLHLFSFRSQARIQTDYGSNLCLMGRVDECVQYFERLKPVFEKEKFDGVMLTFSEEYSEALILAGRYKEAKDWSAWARVYYYNIQEARRNDQIQEWQAKYEASEKEAKIQLLEQQKQTTQSRLINLALLALFSIGILSFFIYRNRNQKRQLALQLERDREIAANRDRLFSSITHDIRTPLSLMMAPLERVEKKISDDSAISDIQLARRNGKRLMELFNQILDWNKAEAKALRLNAQVGQLDFTFDALSKRFEQQAKEKAVNFSQKIEMPQGQFLLDYDKLDKILSNLIGNAIKFCDPKTGVQLAAHVDHKEEHHTLILKVSDQGPGIAPTEQKHLFQRFVQGEQGKLKGGTGIGLALVKELVALMKGEIQLDSEKGKGTTFEVRLPIEWIDEEPVESLLQSKNYPSYQEIESVRKPSLLIVEDEPELLNFLKTALSEDYEVSIANSTTTGLNLAISRIPEIIISDWTLPDNNGGWFCRQIGANELTAHIPILILTAHSSDRNQKEALDAGAIAWMNKPFDLEVLKIQLDTILQQQHRVQKNWTNKIAPGKLPEEKTIEKVDPFMQKVLDVIEVNYQDEHFSVEKLAGQLFLSRIQLFRKVKNITGRGPSKLINEYRLKKGQQLLKQSPSSIAEVAFQVGFSDPNYFGRVYKEYFNVTPSQDMTH